MLLTRRREHTSECCAFPQATHDDDVDAFTQLVARCVERAEESKYFTGIVW
jgi:phage terminase large subunit-like protein